MWINESAINYAEDERKKFDTFGRLIFYNFERQTTQEFIEKQGFGPLSSVRYEYFTN